jgi:predicted butyrate kinase (DUF1464 family)
MARRDKLAEYMCVTDCTFDIVMEDGETLQKLFKAGQGDVEGDMLHVQQGELVCKHFVPVNEIAEDDRDDQIENPEKYIATKRDLILISEIMVKGGMFRRLSDAMDAVKQSLPEDVLSMMGDNKRDAAVKQLTKNKDAKVARAHLAEVLKRAGIKFFKGADPEALAGLVFDNGLYEAAG